MSNQIVQKVRDACWRAATTQPIVERIKPLLVQAKESLADFERALSQRLSPPLEAPPKKQKFSPDSFLS